MKNDFAYEIRFRINLGKVIPEIGEMMERLNADLSRAGYDEKLMLSHDGIMPPMILTVDRELTTGEQETVKNILLGEMCKSFPKYEVQVSEFRRQSGNAPLLAASAS